MISKGEISESLFMSQWPEGVEVPAKRRLRALAADKRLTPAALKYVEEMGFKPGKSNLMHMMARSHASGELTGQKGESKSNVWLARQRNLQELLDKENQGSVEIAPCSATKVLRRSYTTRKIQVTPSYVTEGVQTDDVKEDKAVSIAPNIKVEEVEAMVPPAVSAHLDLVNKFWYSLV